MRGYLTGSIDLVVRVGEAFAIVDYKTNWLARARARSSRRGTTARPRSPPRWSTRTTRLQALLYTAALHRYLRWRLPGYDPERHLAGVLYLFVRGMTGDAPETPCGVFAWRPPARAGRRAQRRARPRA